MGLDLTIIANIFACAALAAAPLPPQKEHVLPVFDTGWEISEPAGWERYQAPERPGTALHWRKRWRRTYRKDHRRAVGEGTDEIMLMVLESKWTPKGEWAADDACRGGDIARLKPVAEGSTYGAPTFSFVCEDPTPDDNNSQRRMHFYDVLFEGRGGGRFIRLTFSPDLPDFVVRSDADVEIPAVREAVVSDGPNLKAFRLMMGTLHPAKAAASPDGPAASPPAAEDGRAVPLLR